MNFEIIPNWHPIFVHFSIALLSISTMLLLIGKITPEKYSWKNTALIVSKWNLLIGAVISIITVLAGWYAYNTVNHDEPSHLAMTSHMKWALSTFSLFVVVAIWTFISRRKGVSNSLTALQIFATLLLLVTGFKGGEIVYRYGLGVMSVPEAEAGEGHEHANGGSHQHNEGVATSDKKAVEKVDQKDVQNPQTIRQRKKVLKTNNSKHDNMTDMKTNAAK